MSWNLPPGVTGSEWQIAGPDFEQDMERVCEADVETVPLHLAQEILDAVVSAKAGGMPDTDKYAILIRQSFIGGPCGWEGEVTVTGYRGVLTWTCPACGTDHEDEE